MVFTLDATAQTYRPMPHVQLRGGNLDATQSRMIHGQIAAVLTNANTVLLQEYEPGKTNLIMVKNVTNGVAGQQWGCVAKQRGFVDYQGFQLQLWEMVTIPSRPTEISGDIVAVLTNAVVVQEFDSVPSAYGANEYGQRIVTHYTKNPTIKVMVQNVNITNRAEGETVSYRAMREGVTNYQGHTLELWTH